MSELNLIRIGNLIKTRRIGMGLSIRELSAKSGVAAGTISQIETENFTESCQYLFTVPDIKFPDFSAFS